MVVARTNDAVVEAFSPSAGVRFLYADATGVARRLVQGHGVSPAAAPVFGRILACAALLQVDFLDADETLVVSADLAGRLGGFLVELDGRGWMRGHPFEPRPDELPPPRGGDPADLFGPSARVKLTRVRRKDGTVRSQMAMETPEGKAATPETLFSELLSSAVPSRVCACAGEWEGEPERVRALAAQRVPGGSERDFARVAGRIDDGSLESQLSSDPSLEAMRDVLALPDLFSGPTRALAFGCSCSEGRILGAWAGLPRAELEATLRLGRPRVFRCHLCGREWTIPPEKVFLALQAKLRLSKRKKETK